MESHTLWARAQHRLKNDRRNDKAGMAPRSLLCPSPPPASDKQHGRVGRSQKSRPFTVLWAANYESPERTPTAPGPSPTPKSDKLVKTSPRETFPTRKVIFVFGLVLAHSGDYAVKRLSQGYPCRRQAWSFSRQPNICRWNPRHMRQILFVFWSQKGNH